MYNIYQKMKFNGEQSSLKKSCRKSSKLVFQIFFYFDEILKINVLGPKNGQFILGCSTISPKLQKLTHKNLGVLKCYQPCIETPEKISLAYLNGNTWGKSLEVYIYMYNIYRKMKFNGEQSSLKKSCRKLSMLLFQFFFILTKF